MTIFKKLFYSKVNQSGWTLIEALAAIVVVGIGVALFTKVQRMTSRDSATNSKILIAGKMVEKHLEDVRIYIAADTLAHWPPTDSTALPNTPDSITIVRKVTPALSPQDSTVVLNTKQLEITASWKYPYPDSLKVTNDVAKRF